MSPEPGTSGNIGEQGAGYVLGHNSGTIPLTGADIEAVLSSEDAQLGYLQGENNLRMENLSPGTQAPER